MRVTQLSAEHMQVRAVVKQLLVSNNITYKRLYADKLSVKNMHSYNIAGHTLKFWGDNATEEQVALLNSKLTDYKVKIGFNCIYLHKV